MNLNAPVAGSKRIESIDVLRGLALLGILVMNMQTFAMITAAYDNPTAYGNFSGINYGAWWFSQVFFDQKMMAIFSMLFGAGIALIAQRAEEKSGKSASIHYRRMLWLLLIGMLHAYLIWFGDILVCYALCGMVFYWLRRLSWTWLLAAGCLLLTVPSLINVLLYLILGQFESSEFEAVLSDGWLPDETAVQAELDAYRGSWWQQMDYRLPMAFVFQTFLFGLWSFWRAGGLMLVGMSLFQQGVLTGKRSNRFYAVLAIAGLSLGIPIRLYGIYQNEAHQWSAMYCQLLGSHYSYWGSLATTCGYIALVMLAVKNCWLPTRLQSALAAVGRTALTNYLLQSVICTWIFYGHGLGLFGHVSRSQQLLIVMVIWLLQLIGSTVWLSYFRFGPIEWIWRSLSYWKVQPLRVDRNMA